MSHQSKESTLVLCTALTVSAQKQMHHFEMMNLHHCQFFMQKLRTRIAGDLAGRFTSTTFKVSSLQIVNDWKQGPENFRHHFNFKFYKCIPFRKIFTKAVI